MDLEKMLDRCLLEQWDIDDVRWDLPVRPMNREMEVAIVQCFKDMAGGERLAAALFAEQARRAEDPALRRIFETFFVDELRHAEAAERLAARHDVNKLRSYAQRPTLLRSASSFIDAVRYLPPDVAGGYIMVGALVLDVTRLRSLDDAASDPTTREVMRLIDQDESRHIAVALHMSAATPQNHAPRAWLSEALTTPR